VQTFSASNRENGEMEIKKELLDELLKNYQNQRM
jgi:hypothetical protein